ncbi:MAG TPA: hypothetical protein VIG24_18230 [Acidimicrobiia bacterium]
MTRGHVPAVAVLAGAVVADVIIIARGYVAETEVLRTRTGKVFTILLAGHVFDVLGPADPFRLIAGTAERLGRWIVSGAHVP